MKDRQGKWMCDYCSDPISGEPPFRTERNQFCSPDCQVTFAQELESLQNQQAQDGDRSQV